MKVGSRRFRVADLFSGAGGLSLGFHAAGFEISLAVDGDEITAETFQGNFRLLQSKNPPRVFGGADGDLERLDLTELAASVPIDVLIGGPPCQSFSRIGRAKLDHLARIGKRAHGFRSDPRQEMLGRFLDAAAVWRPLAVLMENVPGIQGVDGRDFAEAISIELEQLGYRVGFAVLNAVWFGVPQYRDRLFVMGIRSDLGVGPGFPPASHRAVLPAGYGARGFDRGDTLPLFPEHDLKVDLTGAKQEAVTVGAALDDLPRLAEHLEPGYRTPRGDYRMERKYRTEPTNDFARLMRRWPGLPEPAGVVDHAIRFTPRDFETFRRMAPGDRYEEALEISWLRVADEWRHRYPGAPLPEKPDQRGAALVGGTEFEEIVRATVPPYRDDGFPDKWRKLKRDEPSWTVPAHLAKDTYSHIHYDSDQARAISLREAARLQSFPDAFLFAGNLGDGFRQVGNAVPPLLAKALACRLRELLEAGDQQRGGTTGQESTAG